MVHIYSEKLKAQFNGESMHERNSSKSTSDQINPYILKNLGGGHFIFFIILCTTNSSEEPKKLQTKFL